MRVFVFCFLMITMLNNVLGQGQLTGVIDIKRIEVLEKTLQSKIDSLGAKHIGIAVYYDSLAKLCYYRYSKADSLYKKALKIRIKNFGKNHLGTTKSYKNLASFNFRSGNYHQAKEYYKKTLDVLSSNLGENHIDLANSYAGLGEVYWYLNNHEEEKDRYLNNCEKAKECYEKSLAIRLNNLHENHIELANSYADLGEVYRRLRVYEKAKEYYKKSLAIKLYNLGENHFELFSSYRKLGLLCSLSGDSEGQIEYYEKLLELKIAHNLDVTETYESIIRVCLRLNDHERAEYYKIKLELEQFNYGYDHTSSYSTRIEYLNNLDKKFDKYYSLAAKNTNSQTSENAMNLSLNTKSITLDYNTSLRNIIHKIDDKELINIEEELRKTNKNIANAEMVSLKDRINNPNGLIETGPMYNYRDSLERKIRENKKLRENMKRTFIEWQEVYEKLKENEITVDVIRFNEQGADSPKYKYCAILLKKDFPTPLFINLVNEEAISSLLKTNNNGQPKYLQNISYRKELHKKIWQPLLPYLEGMTTIHISPIGLLHRVSFEALQDEKEQYLGEQFQFHYYSSMRDFTPKKTMNHSYKDAVLMGDILYDLEDTLQYHYKKLDIKRNGKRGKVKRLEATLYEVKDIHKACDNTGIESKVLTFNQATEDTIQYFSGKRAPSILHLATHGLYLEPIDVPKTGGTTEERLRSLSNPLQRAVLMLYGANHRWEKNEPTIGTDEDGILTALEVTALDLRKTDLVVLSACSTALGEVQHNTEGVFGLQRAFKLAGVDYVVASLWDVDDDATKDLMVEFYKNLLERKQDPATALRNAKHKFIRAGDDPELWAGFILIE